MAVEVVTERLSLDVRHDVIEEALDFAGVIERQDMRVGQSRGDFYLAQEPLGPERCGDFGPEHFDRDATAMLEIHRQVDSRHPAAPKLALDRVAAGERGFERGQQIGHAVARGGGTTPS